MKTFFVSYRLDFDKHFLERLQSIRYQLSEIGEAWVEVPQFAVIRCDDESNTETIEWAFYRGGFDKSRDSMTIFEAQPTRAVSIGDQPDYRMPSLAFQA
ncbi:hypothetical protein QBK99_04965 [Corticibacterium sp. UT-5YL-CI-8]|nr:hypothetical protein [Tianweitania sp. UT-5YL-CI-8]